MVTSALPLETRARRGGTYDWRYIVEVARNHKRSLILANIVALFATTCSVPLPLLMPLMVDEVLLNQPGPIVAVIDATLPAAWHGPILYIVAVLIFSLFLRLTSSFLGVWQMRQFTIVAKDVTFRIRRALLAHLGKVSMAEYEVLGSGAVASYLVTDLETIDEFVGITISRLLTDVLSVLGVITILFLLHWKMAFFVLLFNPFVFYFSMILGKRVKRLKQEENSAFAIFQQSLVETLDSIHQIRASNRERHYLKRIIDEAAVVRRNGAAFAWKNDAAKRISTVVLMTGFDVFRAIYMLMVVFSDLSIGQMFAVFSYFWFTITPVQELLNMQYSWYGAKAALERINHIARLESEPEYPHTKNPFTDKRTVGVAIRNLYFDYGAADVLNGLRLEIAPGEKIALVGASGGGKSTLVQILIGLYTPRAGMVYYDGVPATEIGLDVIRENVATVLQDPVMFNSTIKVNLTMGRDVDKAHLWRALEIAQLEDVVAKLPESLDTVIGRRGLRLSSGQRQRLAIARMMLSEPKVVILDEASSALDMITESRMYDALADFLECRTTLIIAHRLSAIRHADRVYVFEAGAISEQGSHRELLARNGLYSQLYGVQDPLGR